MTLRRGRGAVIHCLLRRGRGASTRINRSRRDSAISGILPIKEGGLYLLAGRSVHRLYKRWCIIIMVLPTALKTHKLKEGWCIVKSAGYFKAGKVKKLAQPSSNLVTVKTEMYLRRLHRLRYDCAHCSTRLNTRLSRGLNTRLCTRLNTRYISRG